MKELIKARTALILDEPFYGHILLKLELVENESVETAGVDGVSLFYAPSFIKSLSEDELKGVLLHETMHIALKHHLRRENRQQMPFNVACDLAINPMILEMGYALPKDHLYEEKFKGMSAERIYNEFKIQELDPPTWGFVHDHPNPKGKTDKQLEDECNTNIIAAYEVARMRGKLPKHMQQTINEIIKPKIDWRAELHALMKKITAKDFSWKCYNRRLIDQGYFPGRYGTSIEDVVIAIDTSGSIQKHELAMFLAEIKSIFEDVKPKVTHVVQCDAEVTSAKSYDYADIPEDTEIKGRGGTDFRPVFAWVEDQGLSPTTLIYLTDLNGPAPEEAAPYPTIWVSTTEKEPSWGECIRLSA